MSRNVPLATGEGQLSPEKSKPLYQQLKEVLAEQIKNGILKPEQRLPSEKELCAMYNVSRITVRQALAELAREGLIYRSHGKGTFVARPRIHQELVRVTPFEETLRSKGLEPSTEYLGSSLIAADYHLATVLAIPIATQVTRLELLGLGNNEPMVYYVSYFAGELGEKLSDLARELSRQRVAFSTLDLYKKAGLPSPSMLTQSFEAVAAGREQARILGVKQGEPLLLVTSLVYTAAGRPVEYKRAAYRGDKYSFYITRPVNGGEGYDGY
ncbi:GntR family transcriptional regulator [Thermanaeromonas sp. C210]|uniref:GntR family transcriptional regulator n=1 Tax=Thermanaeromonas sp. C210 TaxID=2731925 RepID=UPI00155D542F|nr:GntR family transcriptional regulator [Thermanaeromonas sp. C210]GFN22751.1 HTH-type transcriptional repressor YvoA [Thermanaeromonas sp. C210]